MPRVIRSPFADQLAALRAAAGAKERRTDRPEALRPRQIKRSPGLFQPRRFDDGKEHDPVHVATLVSALKAKPANARVLDPVLVTAIGDAFYLVDGHHRLLAYDHLGISGPVPVEVYVGSVEDAALEAIGRNARDRLPMSHEEKMEAAWRLVLMDGHSKRDIARMSGASDGTVATMRRVAKALPPRRRASLWPTWKDAMKALKEEDRRELSDAQREAQVREWARRLGRAFGKKALGQPEMFADALEAYSTDLPAKLIEHWAALAYEVVTPMLEDDPDAF